MFSLYDLIIFMLLVLAVIYWWRTREQHAVALSSAKKYCEQRDIQLLDETLVFKRFAMTLASNGRRYFSRVYSFDFCQEGMDRHKGEIILRGYAVIRVMLEKHELEITEYR